MKTFEERAKELLYNVKRFEADERKDKKKLASDCWFLDENTVLAYRRKSGDSRYPYSHDGLTLWAYSSGNISVQESLFNVFLDSREGKEPYIAFFAGQQMEDCFFPVSLLGTARQPIENGIKRYTVYTPEAVYYFTETTCFWAVVRVFVDTEKRICFSSYIENISKEKINTYLSSYFDPFLRHSEAEDFECKWYKSCSRTDFGFKFKVTEYFSRENCSTHYALLKTYNTDSAKTTTSRFDFTGGTNESLNCSFPLQTGTFEREKNFTEFTDMAVAGTLNAFDLQFGAGHREDYLFVISDDEMSATENVNGISDLPFILDREINLALSCAENSDINKIGIKFTDLSEKWAGKEDVLNYFIRNVERQTEFCARAKNYAGPFIGIRDIFQQVEAAIAWMPDYCRNKIVEALNYIGDNGRAPRQYSYPANEHTPPKMDLRQFIDQGVWIISTVYTYLAFTDDYSILNETCGYYNFDGNTVSFSDRKDTVLEHLISITEYLISNIDPDTGCLKALYGDWNDALDGLGKTEDQNQEFGNGVSVMASLQLYRNLSEISEILQKTGKFPDKAVKYLKIREDLKNSLIAYSIVENNGERKILHGWGNNRSWFVGSFKDSDGYSRDGLTSNAFWILSGLYRENKDILPYILKAYNRLDSKYGLKTFEPYFPPENNKVGRINRLPKGTAENGATYIHATLFGIWSLFEIGESRFAWDQMYKILPITHDYISTTPFVMPNSYVYNEDKGFDGESMNDWFTGSGCVLLKVLIGGVFGIKPTLDTVKIETCEHLPSKKAEIALWIKRCKISLKYENLNVGKRKYFINEKEVDAIHGIILDREQLSKGSLSIEITD